MKRLVVLSVLLLSGCATAWDKTEITTGPTYAISGSAAPFIDTRQIPWETCARYKSRCDVELCHKSSLLGGRPFHKYGQEFNLSNAGLKCYLKRAK